MHFAGPFAQSYGSIFNYSLPLRGPSTEPPSDNPDPFGYRHQIGGGGGDDCLSPLPLLARLREAQLTLGEAWRVVVDVGQGDADRGGSGEPTHLPGHVFGLDHDLVVLLDLPVHARQGGLDQA